MKIERHFQPRSTIEAFADAHDLTMIVYERKPSDLGFCWTERIRFFAHFKNANVKDGSTIVGVFGNGATPEEAIENYAPEISGKLLVINAGSPERKEVQVPLLTKHAPQRPLSEDGGESTAQSVACPTDKET